MNSSENNILSHAEKNAIHDIIIDCLFDKKSRLLNINDAETSLSSNSIIYLASILNKLPFITRINLLGSRFIRLSRL